MRRSVGVALVIFLCRCAHQNATASSPPPPNITQLVGVERIQFDLNAPKLVLAPILENVERSPMSRQINAAFAFDPKKPPHTMLPAGEDADAPDPTAFEQPATLRIGAERVASLQQEIDLVLRLLLEQERKHAFHGSAVAAAAANRRVAVEIVDDDRAGIVRSRCEESHVVLSAGFIRRLLERSIAAAGGRIFDDDEKPERWPTDEEGSWPPSLTYTIAQWRETSSKVGLTMSPTIRKMLEIATRTQREIIPAIDAALAKAGRPPNLDTFAEIHEAEGNDLPIETAAEINEELKLGGEAGKTLNAVAAEAKALLYEPNPKAAQDIELMEMEGEALAEDVLEPLGNTFVLARFAQEQYLKALAFVIAHEAAHLWIDGCAPPTNETENAADAYATLVAFELFHGHQSRVEILETTGFMGLPVPPRDDTKMEQWMVKSLGLSGFDVIAETFGRSGIAPDPMHDDFDTRSEHVLALYASLVKTVARPADGPP